MKQAGLALMSLMLIAGQPAALPAMAGSSPLVAGWVERITFPDKGVSFEAKLDTGADTSSVNGRNVERFRRGGVSFVRFDLSDDAGRGVRVEAPVLRRVRIKRAGEDDDTVRAVIQLSVCVGGVVTDGEFTVADRADLKYQVLIGRNVLAGRILVDSSRTRILSGDCPAVPR